MGPSPFVASIDAMWGALQGKNNDTVYHDLSNIVVTRHWLNLVKGTWPPTILGLLRLSQEVRLGITALSRELLDYLFDNMALAVRAQGFSVRTVPVLRVQSSEDYLNNMPNAMYQPQMVQDSVPRAKHMIGSVKLEEPSNLWDKQKTRINDTIAELETKHGNKFYRGSNGAPWLFLARHKPRSWSWTYLRLVFRFRLHRMKSTCNRRHETIDNSRTLFLECVIQ